MIDMPRFVVANMEDLAEVDGQVVRRRWEVVGGQLNGAVLSQHWHVIDRVTGKAVLGCSSEKAAIESADKLSKQYPDGLPEPE